MGFIRSLYALSSLISITNVRYALPYKHEAVAVQVQRRQELSETPASTTVSMSDITSKPGVLTYVTPSPGASPIAVTQQSQVVTTYEPQYTLCELPDVTFYPQTVTPAATYSPVPYKNVTLSVSPNSDTCTTVYSSSETTVCATTITGLASKIPVSACDEDVTFSTEYGFTLTMPSPTYNAKRQIGAITTYANSSTPSSAMITLAPTLETLTTYYLAPWTELTAGTAPSDVTRKVCSAMPNGTEECVREYEVWYTTPITITAVSTVSINFTTTIHGPSQVIIYQTGVANVTEQLTTISMATIMELEYTTEVETTMATQSIASTSTSTSTGSTVTSTITLEEATPPVTSHPGVTSTGSSDSLTTTSTITTTSTTTGTTTITLSSLPTAPAARNLMSEVRRWFGQGM